MRRAAFAVILHAIACTSPTPNMPNGIEAQCTTREECTQGQVCVDGRCTSVEEAPPTTVTLAPATATITVGGTLQLTAESNLDGPITLSCDPAAGAISATGLFTASATPGSYTLTASIAGAQTTSTVITTAIEVPSSFSATATASSVTLSWVAVSGATGYRVWRAPDEGSPATDVIDVSTTDYTDSNVILTRRYVYRVQALSNAVAGPFSDFVPVRVLSGHSFYVSTSDPTREILVFDAQQQGQTAPWRRFALPASTTAQALQVSAPRNELYVLATGNKILTYARDATTGALPKRQLDLPGAAFGFALDDAHGRFYVGQASSIVRVFDINATGAATELASITNAIREADGGVCVVCDIVNVAFNPSSSQLYVLGDDTDNQALRVSVYDWNQTDHKASSLTNDEYDGNAQQYVLGAVGSSICVFSIFQPSVALEEYTSNRFLLSPAGSATAVAPEIMGSNGEHYEVIDVTRNPLDPSALLMLIHYGSNTSPPDATRIEVMNNAFVVQRTLDGGAAGWGSQVSAIAAD